MLAKIPEHAHVVLVGATTLDKTHIDRPIEHLLVVERGAVESHYVRQFQNALVYIEQRHMAAETSGEGYRRQSRLFEGGGDRHGFRLASISLPMGILSKRRLPFGTR